MMLLNPSRQRHHRCLAPHFHAIEEAHAQQRDGQTVALRNDRIDIVHGDVANAYGLKLDTISGNIVANVLRMSVAAPLV